MCIRDRSTSTAKRLGELTIVWHTLTNVILVLAGQLEAKGFPVKGAGQLDQGLKEVSRYVDTIPNLLGSYQQFLEGKGKRL